MQPLLINLAPVVFIGLLAFRGWRRGLVAVAATLLGLIGGIALAGMLYTLAGRLLAASLHVPVSIADLASYIGLIVVGQLLIMLILRALAVRIPRAWHTSKLNGVGGVLLAGVQGIAAAAVIYGLLFSLPIGSSSHHELEHGLIAAPLVNAGRSLQSLAGAAPIADVDRAVSLLAVDPESTQSTPLGFTTTDVVVSEMIEQHMLVLVNRERTAAGLSTLRMNDAARRVARGHSGDMLARGYFSHVDQSGRNPFDRMRAGGVRFAAAGENIALAPTLVRAHDGLMNSPPHRENILNPAYKTVGIGILDAGQYGLMITQDFTD